VKEKMTKKWEMDSLVGEKTRLDGKMRSEKSVRIDGELFGNIECEEVVIIGKKGIATSDIKAKEVILEGIVNGSVITEKLVIKATGKLIGDTNVKSLIVEEGGKLFGRSAMLEYDHQSAEAEDNQNNEQQNYQEENNDEA